MNDLDDGGNTLLESLDQGVTWGRPGEEILIEDLTADHIDNIIRWLTDRAESLKLAYDMAFLSSPEPTGEQARVEVGSAYGLLLAQSALSWLNETPLMRRLLKIQEERRTR